jgi:hypothetical protein
LSQKHLSLCAEIGDWRRFEHPDSIACYVGLVASEHSSGQSRRLGKITKAGSTHARRLLVEAALHYRLSPSVGGKLAVRQRGQDPALIDHAWRVQRRLNARWNLLRNGRGKPAGIVTIAIARELVGACWEIATAPLTALPTGGRRAGNLEPTPGLEPGTPSLRGIRRCPRQSLKDTVAPNRRTLRTRTGPEAPIAAPPERPQLSSADR